MANKTSQHILPTAANLLGFCLIVITSIHITGKTTSSILDEMASVIGLILCISVMFSFTSIKTENIKWTTFLERMANVLFGVAVIGIGLILLIFLNRFWLI